MLCAEFVEVSGWLQITEDMWAELLPRVTSVTVKRKTIRSQYWALKMLAILPDRHV
jgi:hypothetical protein